MAVCMAAIFSLRLIVVVAAVAAALKNVNLLVQHLAHLSLLVQHHAHLSLAHLSHVPLQDADA